MPKNRIDLHEVPVLEGWMTLPEAADALGYSRQYVHALAANGKFKTIHRVGTYLIVSTDEIHELCS